MILLVAGTRPNFMKVAPVHRALRARGHAVRLLHTGQHFDQSMSEVFFRDLGMPSPDVTLVSGGGTHAEQTAAIVVGVERELVANRPALLVVVGDVTGTLAAALAASKLAVPIVHVESGLRSRDWTMPEEINRVLTDQLSDLLLTPSRDAEPNLLAEGIPKERIVFVGNVMIDSLLIAAGQPTGVLSELGLKRAEYALVTLHRPANVDTQEALLATLDVIEAIAARLPVLFPVHPRTRTRIVALGLAERLERLTAVKLAEPLGYRDFVTAMAGAKLVATDSGGIQEETTALGIPCLTLRGGTERPITVTEGTNVVVGLDRFRVGAEVAAIVDGRAKRGKTVEGWDGKTGERIVDAIERCLAGSPPPKTAGARA